MGEAKNSEKSKRAKKKAQRSDTKLLKMEENFEGSVLSEAANEDEENISIDADSPKDNEVQISVNEEPVDRLMDKIKRLDKEEEEGKNEKCLENVSSDMKANECENDNVTSKNKLAEQKIVKAEAEKNNTADEDEGARKMSKDEKKKKETSDTESAEQKLETEEKIQLTKK